MRLIDADELKRHIVDRYRPFCQTKGETVLLQLIENAIDEATDKGGGNGMTYKEALETMCRRCTNYAMCQGTGCNPKNVLAELIDKLTPKKPNRYDRSVCPVCNSKANYGHPYTNYCCHCGQALDWTEEGGEE